MTLGPGSVPDPRAPHLSLFNTEAFYDLRSLGRIVHELLADGRIVGHLVGTAVARRDPMPVFVSGHYAPYGGIDWLARVTPEAIGEAIQPLMFMSGPVEVKCAPMHVAGQASTLVALHRVGFRVQSAELSYYIDLPGTVDAYERRLKRPARAALAATYAGLNWSLVDDEASWRVGYDLLDANRRAKGRTLSFGWDYLGAIRAAFPGLVRMIHVGNEHSVTAAAVIYRVGRGRDMVQWWGDLPEQSGRSPMNVLARACVEHSIATGATVLDLGVSSNDGVPDGGLARFKRSVGATAEVRWTLCRP